MAGSQLKQLKEALKSKGLIGQTNIKKKNKKSKTPSETRRNDKQEVIGEIRDQFNQFDHRINRTKHDVTIIQGGKFVKLGSKQHNDATRSHSTAQKTMKMQYDLEKSSKGRAGGMVDRRFGENNKHLTAEEKMLERFTRERQASSKKRSVFSIESDNEDDDDLGGFTLTHSGKALTLDDEDEMGLPEDGLGSSITVRYVDEDQLEAEREQEGQPARKKTKKEVMKEVIAKSKFYKNQRQQEFKKAQDDIMDLDDDFGDVMQELGTVQQPRVVIKPKTAEELEYDSKVRELTYDRRSVPADRTKTEEEVKKAYDEKMKKLETDRLRRMNGLDVDDRAAEGDDLDDEFWAGSDEDEQDGFALKDSEEDREDEGSSEEDEEETATTGTRFGRTLAVKKQVVSIPSTHDDFVNSLKEIEEERQPAYVKKIVETYKPNLAEGNKERMNVFVGVLFEHVLYLSNQETSTAGSSSSTLLEQLMEIIKKLSESYNQVLVENIRLEINEIQERIVNDSIVKRDLVFFVFIGYLFSTSDHYHLIVTPTVILMNQILTTVVYSKDTSVSQIGRGLFVADIMLNYQRFSHRYVPEVVNFLQKAMLLLVPEATKIPQESRGSLFSTSNIINSSKISISKSEKFSAYNDSNVTLSISQLFEDDESAQFKFNLLVKSLYLVDKLASLWKEKSALIEIIEPFIVILKHMVKYYATTLPQIATILNKLVKIKTNLVKERKPLTLQHHRSLAIATFAPKFEENFNPDKKSYDINRERQELNKVKNELKKERKAALKDIRQETRFVAGQQIAEKKQMYDAYHKKMAHIVNTISTVEGAEKNEYEREKKQRKNKK
ncbi:putative nucleolar complex protein 14 [Scheffersomyces xylosifermentans]|uniref:putative nucleolar complex protein 14 n=1 Tax=Scheffersomyces xylosifermentans TaxID=1304137 RepID=UPI00315CC399